MSDQQTILTRLGNLFRRNARNGDLPLSHDANAIEPRGTFLRPWARRDASIQQLQDSFNTLTDLMSTIRQSLDGQSRRQEELVKYLSHLPDALQSIPESSRVHGETLRAIHGQLEQQNINQNRLGEILDRMSQSDGEQKQNLDEIRERMDAIRETDETISANLSGLGSALQSVTRNSTAGAQVLEQLRDRLNDRDGQLEQIIHRQGTRFTTMLAVAIFLSISALTAVCVIGYMLLVERPQ